MRCKTNPVMIGVKFCKLVIIGKGNKIGKHKTWLCRCDCGTVKEIREQCLRNYKQISCGCYKREITRKVNTKHGGSKTRLYHIYVGMKQRCNDINHIAYNRYGGKGIKVSDEFNTFEKFKEWALNNGYNETLTIDRIDNNKGYSPDNCRWATYKEQGLNTERAKNSLAKIAKENNIKVMTFYDRIKSGMTIDEAISKPVRCKKFPNIKFTELGKKYGINASTIRSRIRKGMTIEEAVNLPVDLRYSNRHR